MADVMIEGSGERIEPSFRHGSITAVALVPLAVFLTGMVLVAIGVPMALFVDCVPLGQGASAAESGE